MRYVFVGNSESLLIGRGKLDRIGQTVELEPDVAEDYMRGGCALMSEEEVADLDLLSDQMKKFATVGSRINAPKEIKAKVAEAQRRFGDKWQALHAARDAEQKQLPPPQEVEANAPAIA